MKEKEFDLKTEERTENIIEILSERPSTYKEKSSIEKTNLNQTLYSQSSYINPTLIPSERNELLIYGNNLINKYPSKMGKTRVFLFINNYPLISIGPQKFEPILCFFIMTFIYYFFILFFSKNSGEVLNIIHHITYYSYLICHILATFINPGIPSYEYSNKNKVIFFQNEENSIINHDLKLCRTCNCFTKVKDKVYHCTYCNICYMNFEHHCQWIGHCVAKNNKYFYYCFGTSIWVFALGCFGMLFVNCMKVFLEKKK